MADGPEFPCDADLEPYVARGDMDAWQAMMTTTCRAVTRANNLLEQLQKKMDDRAQPAPQRKLTPTPKYI